jgi:hypothetical protein
MSTTLVGSAFALARWFQPERFANRPEDDYVRDEILNDLYDAEAVAVRGDTVLVRTAKGACMIEKRDVGCKSALVDFDYVSSERWERTAFWMNESSVRDLGEALRSKPRADFDAIFVGAEGTR